MIRKSFWEKVAQSWVKRESIELPDFNDGADIPDDFFDDEEIEDLDDFMKSFDAMEEELSMEDFFK